MNQPKASNDSQSFKGKSKQKRLQKTAWQKPQLEQLRVSLDTAFSGGSNIDLAMTGNTSP